MAWTKERLKQVAAQRLGGSKLIVVANREPYIHRYREGEIEWYRPAGGLTTALDPVMQTCGGTWVAHGSGEADRVVVDEHGRVGIPPDDPQYVLRRVWLTRGEEEGYYYGFSNSTLWPMCHQVYARPTFSQDDWDAYQQVNTKFADAVLEEAEGGPALVFVQDYHFALLPRLLKAARPDLVVAQFWHIPWPNSDAFRVCPWADELLEGLLGNDVLAFQTQTHCNNFLDTVDRTLESRIDYGSFDVTYRGRGTRIRPFPISVDPDLGAEYLGADWEARAEAFRRKHRLGERPLLVGVDRVDYTKGIPERLRAVETLLHDHPEWVGKFHFLQIGAPSRTHLAAYRDVLDHVQELVERINWRYGQSHWKPILFLDEHVDQETIHLFYRMAAGCVVSALHDGMNLVAKEFVAARADEQGVLVLSRFAGAARELEDALVVNPYDVRRTAEALRLALTMPVTEQRQRMRRLRRQVQDHNIFRWAGMLLSEVAKLAPEDAAVEQGLAARGTTAEPAGPALALAGPSTNGAIEDE